MKHNIYLSLLVMSATIYAVRALPLTLLRREIKNKFIRSFLYYVPYVSLSVMTFPAILRATGDVRSGLAGLISAVILLLHCLKHSIRNRTKLSTITTSTFPSISRRFSSSRRPTASPPSRLPCSIVWN